MKAVLSEQQIPYQYVDLSASLTVLKSFLVIRDTHDVFKPLRGQRKIGIPLLVADGEPYILDGATADQVRTLIADKLTD